MPFSSIFGQARYKIVPEVELAGGVRYSDEKRRLDTINFLGPVPTGGMFAAPVYLTNPKLHSKNWAPEFTITWTATDDLTIFGAWKRAYKSGSYNIITPTNPDPSVPFTVVNGRLTDKGLHSSYGDEKIQGFEIGIKSRLLDRQLLFNLTGYHYKTTNLQVRAILPAASGLPVLTTFNAASAKIYGIEGDLHYQPDAVPGLELFGAFNWNHARFTSFPNQPCLGGDTFADGCNGPPLAGRAIAYKRRG